MAMILPSPSQLRSAREEEARIPLSVPADALESAAPTLILIEDPSAPAKSHRTPGIPVFSRGDHEQHFEPADAEPLKSDAAHLIDMGLYFFRKGLGYEAVSLYRKALSLAPDNALGHYMLGIALKSLKQEEDALCEWKAALASRELGSEAQWARERAELLLSRAA